MAVFTTDLSDFLVPKIGGYSPDFGTMVERGLTTKEVSENIMYPLTAQRGFTVTETSSTSDTVARNSKFILKESGITLTIGNGIEGITVDIYNHSSGDCIININGADVAVQPEHSQNYEYLNGTWVKAGAYDDLLVNNDLTVNGKATIGGYEIVEKSHNIPRLVPKDITDYYTDGTLYDRIAGTNGFSLFEDLYVGDYFQMSRAISAYERTGTYQATGSEYVTIAGLDTLMGNGDDTDSSANWVAENHHAVMVPGKGFGGDQHFGRSRMNSSNTTAGGYAGSEMFTTTIGAVTTSGDTSSTASINAQLYAEFGSHLKTTRELLSTGINASGYNRFGVASGSSNDWAWTSCQAVLMSEVECYGSIVFSSSGYDTGTANRQMPLFAHSKQAQNNRSAYYWLKDVGSAVHFCSSDDYGLSNYVAASDANFFVRPRFVIA